MLYNQLHILYSYHILKQGGNHNAYFDYDEKYWGSDRIKAGASVRK